MTRYPSTRENFEEFFKNLSIVDFIVMNKKCGIKENWMIELEIKENLYMIWPKD